MNGAESLVRTLSPGDVMASSSSDRSGGPMTPPRWVKPGDRIGIGISGVGVLSNVVR